MSTAEDAFEAYRVARTETGKILKKPVFIKPLPEFFIRVKWMQSLSILAGDLR